MDNLFSTHPNTENRVAELEKLAAELGTSASAHPPASAGSAPAGPWGAATERPRGPWG
jgi:heat shock protein HtpX